MRSALELTDPRVAIWLLGDRGQLGVGPRLSGPRAAFSMGIAPFLVADIIKVGIGAALLPYAQRLIARLP